MLNQFYQITQPVYLPFYRKFYYFFRYVGSDNLLKYEKGVVDEKKKSSFYEDLNRTAVFKTSLVDFKFVQNISLDVKGIFHELMLKINKNLGNVTANYFRIEVFFSNAI